MIDYIINNEKPPIIQVLRDYYPDCGLVKRGKYWKCRCIFHNERTASMVIYEDQDRVHCFGCGHDADSWDVLGLATGKTFGQLRKESGLAPDRFEIQERVQKSNALEKHQELIMACCLRLLKLYRWCDEAESMVKNVPTDGNLSLMADVYTVRDAFDGLLELVESDNVDKQELGLHKARNWGFFHG